MKSKLEMEGELKARVSELQVQLTGFQLESYHWMSDWVFLNFAADVMEQADATLALVATPMARAAIPNARAALESAIDLYVLLAEPSLYDERGAFVRVCELISKDEFHQTARAHLESKGETVPEVAHLTPEEAVAMESEMWEQSQPGISVTFRRALQTVRADGRHVRHWSGLATFAERVDHIVSKHGAPADFQKHSMWWYRYLCSQAHPSLKTGTRSAIPSGPDQVTVVPSEGGWRVPLAAARFACDHAVHAMRMRSALRHRAQQ